MSDAPRKQDKVELPPEYSRAASMPLSYHFKIVCQLFEILVRDLVADRPITMENAMKGKWILYLHLLSYRH